MIIDQTFSRGLKSGLWRPIDQLNRMSRKIFHDNIGCMYGTVVLHENVILIGFLNALIYFSELNRPSIFIKSEIGSIKVIAPQYGADMRLLNRFSQTYSGSYRELGGL